MRELKDDKWLMKSRRPVTVRISGNGGIRDEYRDNTDFRHPETDKTRILYGTAGEPHYELNEAARKGLNKILGFCATDSRNVSHPVSIRCTNPAHEQNADLLARVEMKFADEVSTVPVWENHTCIECPSLCRCRGLSAIGERILTCENCLKVGTLNHGIGYMNCRLVGVPEVVGLTFEEDRTAEVRPSGSTIGEFERVAARYRHAVLVRHEARPISTPVAERALREATGYTGVLPSPERSDHTIGRDLVPEITRARDPRIRFHLGFPMKGDSVASLTDSYRAQGVLAAVEVARGAGVGWGNAGYAPPKRLDHSLLTTIPEGASDRNDGGEYDDVQQIRDLLARLEDQGHCMSHRLELDGAPVHDLADIQRLNRHLRQYGCHISVPGFYVEIVPRMQQNCPTEEEEGCHYVDWESLVSGIPLGEASAMIRRVVDAQTPHPDFDEMARLAHQERFRTHMNVELLNHIRNCQVTKLLQDFARVVCSLPNSYL